MSDITKIDILPNYYLNEDGTFNLEEALKLSGKIAGVCYDKEGFDHLLKESEEKTNRRIAMTLDNGHHSVYDHISISFNIRNIPKILAMVINNEHQYTTSEKSARYTPVIAKEDSLISEKEQLLYDKWMKIFQRLITEKYGYVYDKNKVKKLAQENARYLVTVFMPTEMIYTTTLRQINYIASWMSDYIKSANDEFEKKLASKMNDFILELSRLNVLKKELMTNDKCRKLSLFGEDLKDNTIYFDEVYSTTYKGSYAQLAQAHRHRTLDYQIERLKEKEYYIPLIIQDDEELVKEWLHDMETVSDCYPQGEMILISEKGKYEDFILKLKERLCSAAQLEIALQSEATLLKYQQELKNKNHRLVSDIAKYTRGARCTFPDFKCTSDCKFKEGKLLTRKI